MYSLEGSDWAYLPKHLLDLIMHKLVSISDCVRFGAVCKPWLSMAMENKVKFFENKWCRQVPFLMVSTEDSNERRSLYNISHNKLYDFELRIPYKKRFCGSSHGWLFTVEESFAITLINPFSSDTIQLPPIMDRAEFDRAEDHVEFDPEIDYYDTTLGEVEDDVESEHEIDYYDTTLDEVEVEFEVMKATLSADPVSSPNDYIVSAIYSGYKRLAFIHPGDDAWTYIDKERFNLIFDVIYYKGNIFAVDYWSRIIMVDLNRRDGESMAAQVKVIAPKTNVRNERTYLVESSNGDLLLVQRIIKYDDKNSCQHETLGFKVFKLLLEQLEQGWPKRVEMKSLDGDTLFLGDNHSISVSASKWPGCQPNSIYYTDDYIDLNFHPPFGRCDIGIFNIENECFGTHYTFDPSHKDMPPSIWIVPTMLGN
ncbi:F-box protein At2g17036-like [Cornus florida]|uniref:F-box protein At2g17036-like n=1 Tax=Cornus florida TaxID=4283 RepID=UPI002899315E|nr:F-box protein At2g17036-like [Cornus florida]